MIVLISEKSGSKGRTFCVREMTEEHVILQALEDWGYMN